MRIPPATGLVVAAQQAAKLDDFGLAALMRQRYGLRTNQSDVNRWRNGTKRGPSYEPTFALMEIAGWLRESRIDQKLAEAAEKAHEALDRSRRARQEPPGETGEPG